MNILAAFKNIKAIALDVDGVLTDGSLFVMPDGSQARRMNIKDGYALQLAVKKNYTIIVISGAKESGVKDRLQRLGITRIYFDITDKLSLLKELAAEEKLHTSEIIYMGDDIPDIDSMKWSGLSCCPADAVAEITNIAHYISPVKGGEGCVRDVLEKVMKMRGDWTADTTVASK